MLPNKQLVKNITDLFKYASHFKKIFLIADKDDGMYDREMAFANFLEMCGLHVKCVEVNKVKYTKGGYMRYKNLLFGSGELYIVSRTRLKPFCDYLVRNNIIDVHKSAVTIENTYFKINGKCFYVIEEGIYGQLGWKFSSKKATDTSFAFHIIDHCNLNCQMCNKFSPLAKEHFIPQKAILDDAKRLCELTDGTVGKIIITGGEPLLHPYLEKILTGIHAIFPNVSIQLQTNGLLLPQKGTAFYELCKNNKIIIWITKYPINFDYGAVENDIKKCGCKFVYSMQDIKTSWKFPVDLQGKQPRFLSLFCWMHGECVNVIEGKITPCGFMHASRCFEEKFNISFDRMEDDYLDMYKISSWNEIDTFLRKIQPFCRYCDINNWEENIPWKTSNREMNEWLA